jgi:hypothetical protein
MALNRTLLLTATLVLAACGGSPPPANPPGEVKIGVLLVAHGSKSPTWVGMVEALAAGVRASAPQLGVAGVRFAYITETKPSIADEMRAFDAEGYGEVIVAPPPHRQRVGAPQYPRPLPRRHPVRGEGHQAAAERGLRHLLPPCPRQPDAGAERVRRPEEEGNPQANRTSFRLVRR